MSGRQTHGSCGNQGWGGEKVVNVLPSAMGRDADIDEGEDAGGPRDTKCVWCCIYVVTPTNSIDTHKEAETAAAEAERKV